MEEKEKGGGLFEENRDLEEEAVLGRERFKFQKLFFSLVFFTSTRVTQPDVFLTLSPMNLQCEIKHT